MLYATVRNRKISVKKPTTIPKGSKNVDVLQIDFDEEWDKLTKTCIFTNHYVTEKKQQKTVTETVITTVVTEAGEGGKELSREETKDVTVVYIDVTDETEQDKDTTTTNVETVTGTDKVTTTTTVTTVKVDKPVIKAEEADVSREQLVNGNEVTVPWECLENVGQLSISIRGYDSDETQLMTTVEADSFWEIVESGEQEAPEATEATATLYEQAVTAVGNALTAADNANSVAAELIQDKATGKFNGKDGKDGAQGKDGVTPNISIGSVETVGSDENADVTATGTTTNVVLNFKLPRGKQGTNTPIKGVDYWTDADKQEIINEALAMLPVGDEVAY